jgi:hypothetical protein
MQQRRLARSGRAHNRGELLGDEFDGDAVQSPNLGLALSIDLSRLDGVRRDDLLSSNLRVQNHR